ENGRRWKQFQNDPSKELEPIIDPRTGDQDVDPNAQLYDWTDPTSGQTVKIKGNQLANAGATIASGNAQRTQSAAQFNAGQQLEASKANASNTLNYNKALFDRLAELGKTNADAQGAYTASQGLYTQM